MNIAGPVTSLGGKGVVTLTGENVSALKNEAALAPLKRARLCLHASADSLVHEMIIAFQSDSYIPPHRHFDKSESFHLVEGELSVALMDDSGDVTKWVHFGQGQPGTVAFYRINQPLWHTVIVRSEFAVIHEVTNGPFRKEEGGIPDWAPDPSDSDAVQTYMQQLREAAIVDLASLSPR